MVTSAAIQPSMDTSVHGLDIGAWASYYVGTDAEEVDFFVGHMLLELAGIGISVDCVSTSTGVAADTEAASILTVTLLELIAAAFKNQ